MEKRLVNYTSEYIAEEPDAVVPHVRICVGAVQVTGRSTMTMPMKCSARFELDQTELNEALVYKNLRSLFPKVNDYASSDSGYSEELNELRDFGITKNKQLRLLLKKHRKQIITIDRSPIDMYHQRMYTEEMGADKLNDHMRRNKRFAYPGLLRIT